MLDWQSKKWIKVIAVLVVVTFLSYDIAWATDFSPIRMPSVAPEAETLPEIDTHKIAIDEPRTIRRSAPQVQGEPDETEISFRSQLIPAKKYEERSGFLRLEAVKDTIKRQQDEIKKRQDIEKDRQRNNIAQYNINKELYMQNVEKAQAFQSIEHQVLKARGELQDALGVGYVLNKDGSKVYFKNGLACRIENEPIYDSLGQRSIKNTWDMQYDARRLLTSYEAQVIDEFGNVTKIKWEGGTWSGDSIWYATSTTNAGKYLLSYTESITDPYGSVITREWSTNRDAYNGARKTESYTEVVKDALGNVITTSTRYGITYEGDNVTSYSEISWDGFGNVTTSSWEGTYNSDNHLLSTKSFDNTNNLDGSNSLTTSITNYTYEGGKLVDASGTTTISGDDGFGNTHQGTTNYFYETVNGQVKLKNSTNVTDYESIDTSTSQSVTETEYIYNESNLLIDLKSATNSTGEDIFGNEFVSSSKDTY